MKKKIILILPLVTVILTTIAFAALHHSPQSTNKPLGLNTSLPGAAFDKHEKPKDKMSFYDQAKLDSDRARSTSNNPLLQKMGFAEQPATTPAAHFEDPTVTAINKKLLAINQPVSQPQTVAPQQQAVDNKALTQQVNRLEGLMKNLKSDGPDPEMQHLSKMLGQIQSIQHPERLTKADSAANPFVAIAAVIDGKQKIKQSSAVKLKLSDTIRIKGQVIPKGTLVFGTATLASQRLLIDIRNIRLGNAIVPVNLMVYAMDGMPGVSAPEAEAGQAAAEGATSALQNMQFLSMDQSLATQAATSGINAAKSLFGKKVKRITVHLKDGQQVLLRDNNIH